MLRSFFFCLLVLIGTTISKAATVKGTVFGDDQEPLIGATVQIKAAEIYTTVGLDGSFTLKRVPVGAHLLEIRFVGYEPKELQIKVKEQNEVLRFEWVLNTATEMLSEVEISEGYNLATEAGARGTEKNSPIVMNTISAKTIESSPDVTVANVVQRVSGLTVERNNNGDGQYAIVRGMNKRYNYTLVNGIKIPSPDNENRYIPLDIFPAELLDQLVVSKSLTPSMEGDAIGGVVDMKMKDAPAEKLVSASFNTGYSELFMRGPFKGRQYDYFNPSQVNRTRPTELVENPGRIPVASIDEFTTENMNFEKQTPRPNLFGSLVLGNRYFDDRLGVVIAGSYQDQFRGADRTEFGVSDNSFGNPNPRVSRYQERRYSIQQERMGFHNKIDFKASPNHKFSLYNAYMRMQTNESRVIWEDGLRGVERPTLENNWRGQVNIQQIYNSTLQGEHKFSDKISADWSLVYSIAQQQMPDNSQIVTVSSFNPNDNKMVWLVEENLVRIWEENSDRDYAGYYNFNFNTKMAGQKVLLKYGGLYRMKSRENLFDLYSFKPNPGVQEYTPYQTDYADLTWRITGGAGTPSHVLNYQSYENVLAQYGEFRFTRGKTHVLGGLRAEHTDQGFSTLDNRIEPGNQEYWMFLPSLHIKHIPTDKINLRTSYFKSLSRPSFLEIIPYRRPATEEIRPQGGNSDLTHVEAHNFDARFEYFPSSVDQILVGVFYKIIDNPIENAIIPPTDPKFPEYLPPATTIVPVNLETAINYGLELDYIKYFNKWGIRANYTFTNSTIESIKRTRTEVTEENYDQLTELQKETIGIGDSTLMNVMQSRPLQGQSRHIGNFSLLYKNQDVGFDAQLSLVFTGERIAVVSAGLDTDWWQRDFTQLDFSAEKKIGKHFTVFCKVNNLLNTPFELHIKKPHMSDFRADELQPNSDTETLVQRDIFQRSYLFGLRYKM